jgi:hypothetical protein
MWSGRLVASEKFILETHYNRYFPSLRQLSQETLIIAEITLITWLLKLSLHDPSFYGKNYSTMYYKITSIRRSSML